MLLHSAHFYLHPSQGLWPPHSLVAALPTAVFSATQPEAWPHQSLVAAPLTAPFLPSSQGLRLITMLRRRRTPQDADSEMLQLTQHAQQPLPPEDGLESGDQQRYQFRLIKLETAERTSTDKLAHSGEAA